MSSGVIPWAIVWGKWESIDEPVKLSTGAKRGIQSAGGLRNDAVHAYVWGRARARAGTLRGERVDAHQGPV